MTTPTKNLETLITTGFNQINQRLDTLETRVVALEQAGPILKTRMVGLNGNGNGHLTNAGPYGNGNVSSAPLPLGGAGGGPYPAPPPDSQAQNQIKYHTGICSRIGITKTKMTGRWKLNCYLRESTGRPASAYGDRTGDWANLIDMFAEVCPELSEDHFSEAEFYKRDAEIKTRTGGKGWYELKLRVPPFKVEWHESAPDGNGKTWAYVDDVYPYQEDR